MSETKALILTAAVLMALTIAVGCVLGALEANGIAWGFLLVGSVAAGAWVLAGVVMRYSDREERKKREELIVSR